MCGLTREKAEGDWKRLHNEEIYKSHPSPNIIICNLRSSSNITMVI